MSTRILFVYEGKDSEPRVAKNLQDIFFDSTKIIVECVFGGEIYQLYSKLEKDSDLNLIGLLKERDHSTMDEWEENDFSEIYLFFDYDGHATGASNFKIEKLLEVFSNETENGKLFINYPSVESLKDIPDPDTFYNLSVSAFEKEYKRISSERCPSKELLCLGSYDKGLWINVIAIHLKKMNYIANDNFILPTRIVSQAEIYHGQFEGFITKSQQISVLNSFPIFIHDYFGNKKTLELIGESRGLISPGI